MIRSRALVKNLSHVAFIDGEIAAFWLIGAREQRAYLISSGTLPQFRRRGLFMLLGQSVVDDLNSRGFAWLQAEVLEENASARNLDQKLGFTEARRLHCYSLWRATKREPAYSVPICDISLVSFSVRQLWDIDPSWQNDIPSLIAAAGQTTCFAIHDQSGLAGYAAFVPALSSLAQIAVRHDRRREGLASCLLAHGQDRLGIDGLRILNVDGGDGGLAAFLRARGASLSTSQKELRLRL